MNSQREKKALQEGAAAMPEHIRVREVGTLAWPIVVSMLSYTAMTVADTIFLGRLGTQPLAAIGLATVTLFTFHAFGNGVLAGVKVSVAQAMGAGDDRGTRRLAWQGLWLAAVLGLCELALAPVSPRLFDLLGASDEVNALATDYFVVRVVGSPLAFGMYAYASFFQGRGDTRTPMVATLLANGLNIALDPLFIFGGGPVPALGMAGAAWATVLGFGAGFVFLAVMGREQLRGTSRRPRQALLRRIWRLGSPIGLRGLLEVGSFTVFTGILADAGDVQLAAHVIVVRIVSVSFLPGYGIAEAASVLVGQAIGARAPHLARQAWASATRLGFAVMTGCGVMFLLVPEPLVAVFDPEAAVIPVALDLLMIAAAFQLFDAIAMVTQGALNGAGDTRFVMVSSVTTAWAIKLPVGYALAVPVGLGAMGAWLGLFAEIVVIAGICLWRVRGERWLQHEPDAPELELADEDGLEAA